MFLDSSISMHPDYVYHKCEPPIKSKEYFKVLNKFFYDFEKNYNLKIKFAAAPKSNRKILKKFLKNRKFHFFRTASLVKNSKLVILHKSSSIFFALKFNKPLLFITLDQIKNNWYDEQIYFSAKIFNQNVININNHIFKKSNKLFKPIGKKIAERYISLCDKSKNTKEKFIWDIFLDYLRKKIFNFYIDYIVSILYIDKYDIRINTF